MRRLLALTFVLTACGAGDVDAPYTPPPPQCPSIDDYLQPLYQLQDEGKLQRLATTLSETVPENARRDLVDALLRLLTAFPEGSFAALKTLPESQPSEGGGLQSTLGKVVRWLAETGPSAPNLPLLGVLRRTISSCEGAPVFALLEEAIGDDALVHGLEQLLGGTGLATALQGLSFEGQNGRAATQYLVRNLFVAAASPTFSVKRILDLLGLLVDLTQPPYDALSGGLQRLLDGDGLPRLQALLVCLGDVDPNLDLGGFLYDLVTSGLLSDLAPQPGTPGSGPVLAEPVRTLITAFLGFIARDADTRRGLVPALLILLRDDVAPGVLGDVANLLEAHALDGLVDLLTDLASGTCHR